MGTKTTISWTDHTFNPWCGCTKIAPGCKNCYAEELATRWGKARWGDDAPRVRTSQKYWQGPLKWNRQAAGEGVKKKVFCGSMCDIFEGKPGLERWRMQALDLLPVTPFLRWLYLTKRPGNAPAMIGEWAASRGAETPIRNLWIGASASDQKNYEDSIAELMRSKKLCRVLYLSLEPLLGPIVLRESPVIHWLDWIIVGGESGRNRRPCEVEWITDAVEQCHDLGIACFVKQDSALKPGQQGRIPDDVWSVKEFPGGGETP